MSLELLCHGYWIKGFASLFCLMLTFRRYIGEYFTFGHLDRVRYNEDLLLLRFVTLRFLHTIYCNFGLAEEYRSLYRGLGYEDVR